MSTPSSRRNLLITKSLFLINSTVIPRKEPLLRQWEGLPKSFRDEMKFLKSDDIKDDVWHLRDLSKRKKKRR